MITLEQIKNNPCARDKVFKHVISLFKEKPVSILEVGCLRDTNSRAGDGWSTVFWADYVQNYGGQLVITNIFESDIEVCKGLINSLFPINQFDYQTKDGGELIDDSYDFIYLDGGDDPKETLNQFNKCNLEKSYVLVDDFHTKGALLPRKDIHTFYQFSNGHWMCLYKKGEVSFEREYIVV